MNSTEALFIAKMAKLVMQLVEFGRPVNQAVYDAASSYFLNKGQVSQLVSLLPDEVIHQYNQSKRKGV